MRALPPILSSFWQCLAHVAGHGGIAFDFNSRTGHPLTHPAGVPHPHGGLHTRYLSPIWRSGPIGSGPSLCTRRSFADGVCCPRFRFSAAMDRVESASIITLIRGSLKWSRNTSCLQRFSQRRWLAAWQPRKSVVLPVRSSAQQLLMLPIKTWSQVPPLVVLPVRRLAAFRACRPAIHATDLIRASGRGVSTSQRPSGAAPRVAFSHLPPRPGRVEGREPCSRRS